MALLSSVRETNWLGGSFYCLFIHSFGTIGSAAAEGAAQWSQAALQDSAGGGAVVGPGGLGCSKAQMARHSRAASSSSSRHWLDTRTEMPGFGGGGTNLLKQLVHCYVQWWRAAKHNRIRWTDYEVCPHWICLVTLTESNLWCFILNVEKSVLPNHTKIDYSIFFIYMYKKRIKLLLEESWTHPALFCSREKGVILNPFTQWPEFLYITPHTISGCWMLSSSLCVLWNEMSWTVVLSLLMLSMRRRVKGCFLRNLTLWHLEYPLWYILYSFWPSNIIIVPFL